MTTSPRRRPRSLALAAVAAACAGVAAHPAHARDATGWTPALAALGDRGASGPTTAAAPLLATASAAAPLLAAGMQATAVTPAQPAVVERAPELTRDETERWVPGFAFTSSMLGQNAEGRVGSDSSVTYRYFARQNGPTGFHNPPPSPCNVNGVAQLLVTRFVSESKATPPAASPGPGQPSQSGSFTTVRTGVCSQITGFRAREHVLPAGNNDLFLTSLVGSQLDVMTPGLQNLPGRPRLAAHGDVILAFGFDRNVAKQGNPIGPIIPVGPITPDVEIRGVGAKTSGEVQPLVYGAGIGPVFSFDAFERRLRLRTTVEWMRQEIQVSGVINKVFQADTGQQQGQDVGLPGGPLTALINAEYLTPIELRARDTHVFHGIGPGLELEMDAARAGPVVLSLFLGGSAYKMLGDREVHLTDDQVLPAQTGSRGQVFLAQPQTVEGEFDFSIHSWAYRGGLGLRFRWLPED